MTLHAWFPRAAWFREPTLRTSALTQNKSYNLKSWLHLQVHSITLPIWEQLNAIHSAQQVSPADQAAALGAEVITFQPAGALIHLPVHAVQCV